MERRAVERELRAAILMSLALAVFGSSGEGEGELLQAASVVGQEER